MKINPLNPPIEITAVHIDVRPDKVYCLVMVNGNWVQILDQPNVLDGGHLSHIIEANGIRSYTEKAA